MHELLIQGDAIYQMMQVTGEEGISIEDFVTWQKATLVDMVFLQQDAFDDVDASMPLDRQLESFQLVKKLIQQAYRFEHKDAARQMFTQITGLYKNLNYSPRTSPEYERYAREIEALAQEFSTSSKMVEKG